MIPAGMKDLVVDLHHVAIAVASIAEARSVYEEALGFTATEIEYVPDQKVNVLVLFAGSQRIELVEPAAEDSPVSRFLEKRGGGLHHLAFRVADLESALAALKSAGTRMIDTTPRPGSHGTKVAFVHPKATGGVLTELVEDPSA